MCTDRSDVRFHLFFFNDTATTEIYTLSLHDALPIYRMNIPILNSIFSYLQGDGAVILPEMQLTLFGLGILLMGFSVDESMERSEEHTSELQSPCNLVCRLLLEKKTLYASLRHDLLRR